MREKDSAKVFDCDLPPPRNKKVTQAAEIFAEKMPHTKRQERGKVKNQIDGHKLKNLDELALLLFAAFPCRREDHGTERIRHDDCPAMP